MKKRLSYFNVLFLCGISLFLSQSIFAATTTTYTKVTSVSQLQDNDIVVFASESAGVVCGPLNNTYLTTISEYVKFDSEKGTVEVPTNALTIKLTKSGSYWQLIDNSNGNLMLCDISYKGAFCYGSADDNHLATWSISISDGEARVATPSDAFPVLFNSDRFKPYKSETSGYLPSLYRKTGSAQEVKSSFKLAEDINLGSVEMEETKSVEVSYTAEYLTDDIIWSVSGTDAQYFNVSDNGDRSSGIITVTYNGKATQTGSLSASVVYLTQDVNKQLMEGSFPISINLVANTVKLTKIEFDNTEYSVNLGETLDLNKHITLTPGDAADKSLTWETSNKAYATIDDKGVLTPLISGSVTVTVSSVKVPEVKTTCTVKITVPAPTGVTVEPAEVNLNIGGKQTLTVNVLPAGANQTVTFSSDKTDVATVSTKGVITAKALGEAVITIATKDNPEIKTTCTVNVVAVTVESIAFDSESVTVTKGSKKQLEPVITPTSAAADNPVVYKSADENIATVSEEGIVTGIAEGETVITATCAGKEAKITVKVVGALMFDMLTDPSILVAKDTIILARKTAEWSVVAGPRDGKKLTVLTENITVTDNAAAADEAIRFVLGAETGGFTLTAVGSNKAIAVAQDGNDIVDANTKNCKVWQFVKDEIGVYIQNVGNTNAYFKYHVGNKAIKPYKSNTVGAEMVYAYIRPYIGPAPVKVTGVTLSNETLELAIDATARLVATVLPKDAKDKSVTWSSSDEDIATVDDNGNVTAVATGTATITVKTKDGGYTASCEVTVLPPVAVTGITLSKTTLTLEEGQTSKLTATIEPEDAAEKSVVWTSSDEEVATVEDGVVTAVKEGIATITAKTVDGGFTATCEVTVTAGFTPVGDKGSKGNPYTVAEVKELNNSVSGKAWVMGYIWGSPASGSSIGKNLDTSIALGDGQESDGMTFIPVQLPSGDARDALGLESHPDNIGRRVKVYGTLEKYFGVAGVKNVSEYEWMDIEVKPTEPTPVPVFSVGSGEVPSGTELIIKAAAASDTVYYSFNRGPWNYEIGEVKIVIDHDVTVSAYTVREGYLPSENVQHTYTITTDALEEVEFWKSKGDSVRKVMYDGVVYILMPDGKIYDVRGRKM